MFKRQANTYQKLNRRFGKGPAYLPSDRMPHVPYDYTSSRRSNGLTPYFLIGTVTLFLLLVVTLPLWFRPVLGLIPDRYILAYAPEAFQRLAFDIDIAEQVPTAAPLDPASVDELLGDALIMPSPTATLSVPSTPAGGYIQPTAIPREPTPTLTPASALAVDTRAEDADNLADLDKADYLLTGFNFQQQGYNNCGPASLSVLMSYWGVDFTQAEAAAFLKPNKEDPNVRPDEMTAYIQQFGYAATVRVNGNLAILKQLLQAGYPVLIETGYDPEPTTVGWTSHFLTLVGYSDQEGGFIAMDTYRRPNWFYPYQEIDTYWRQFNRTYLVVHRPDQEAAVASIVGDNWDTQVMYQNAFQTAQLEANFNRNDPYSWFNMGSSLTNLSRYEEAVQAFDKARELGLPWRFLWYQFEPFEAYYTVGRYDDVITLADAVLEKKATEEAFYWKGLALAAQGEERLARSYLVLARDFNPKFTPAQSALDEMDS